MLSANKEDHADMNVEKRVLETSPSSLVLYLTRYHLPLSCGSLCLGPEVRELEAGNGANAVNPSGGAMLAGSMSTSHADNLASFSS